MQKIVIIVAGGKGLRMGNDLPKQFMPIDGKPVLMHTLAVFAAAIPDLKIVLVLPEMQQNYWKELCINHQFTIPFELANGGETRFHSVKNGLQKATKNSTTPSIIGIHDGVRPFVSAEVIRNAYQVAEKEGTAIPVVEVHETLRKLTDAGSLTVDRSGYRLVQTPQVFRSDILINAYKQTFSEAYTDDASVVEAAGVPILLTLGNRENIKITTPFDLIVAEALLANL